MLLKADSIWYFRVRQINKIFELYSSPFHVKIESAPEYLQMELVDLQCNIKLKHIFE